MAVSTGYRPTDGWVKIYRHHINGGYWSSANGWAEVLESNPTNPDADKYSQLYKFTEEFALGSEFIFKMVMDNYTNIWAQTHNPLLNAPAAATVPGYRGISTQTTANSFGGLSLSDGGSSFLDCNPANTNWYYPVGQGGVWNGGIPQWDATGHPLCELWVKIR